jgi:hypothetical protein
MKNLLTIVGAAALLSACGYSEDKFGDDLAATSCDLLVTCFSLYASVDECLSENSSTGDAECVDYDGKAAKACVDGYQAQVDSCPADIASMTIPSECADVCAASTDSGS